MGAGSLDGVLRDVLFALGLGAVANLALRATDRDSAIAAGLQSAFVGICVFCAFYSVIAAGVFNYFGRPVSYDLLEAGARRWRRGIVH